MVWPAGPNGSARRPVGCLCHPASRIRILASQPACAVRGTLTEALWLYTLYGLAVQLGIRSYSTVVRLYGTAVRLYSLYRGVPYRSVYVCTVATYSGALSPLSLSMSMSLHGDAHVHVVDMATLYVQYDSLDRNLVLILDRAYGSALLV